MTSLDESFSFLQAGYRVNSNVRILEPGIMVPSGVGVLATGNPAQPMVAKDLQDDLARFQSPNAIIQHYSEPLDRFVTPLVELGRSRGLFPGPTDLGAANFKAWPSTGFVHLRDNHASHALPFVKQSEKSPMFELDLNVPGAGRRPEQRNASCSTTRNDLSLSDPDCTALYIGGIQPI